jgi:hypothetical protein
MLNNKQLHQAKTESDKNYLNRKCERLDKEIDQFTYRKVGLFTSLPAEGSPKAGFRSPEGTIKLFINYFIFIS